MKNKTKKTIKILSALLLVVIVNSIGITYAKYASAEKGNGQAEIAKWSFEIQKDGQQTKNIRLLSTTSEDSIKNGKIGPGSSGVIYFTLDGSKSDVDIEYLVDFTNEQNKPKNITFTYEGNKYNALSEIREIHGYILHDDSIKTRDIAIAWEWRYQTGTDKEEIAANDELDTQDANLFTEYTFDIIARGLQAK